VKSNTFNFKLALLLAFYISMPVLFALNEPSQLERIAAQGKRATAVLPEKNVLVEPPTNENFLQRVDRLLHNALPVQQVEGELLNRRIGIYISNGKATDPGTDASVLRSVFWIFLGLSAVLGVFLQISSGGLRQSKQKPGDFKNREFTNTQGLPDAAERMRVINDLCVSKKNQDGEKDGG